MVAVIHPGHSLRMVLNYNEHKLKQERADCILAANYPKDAEDLNFYQKLNRLTHQASLNENVKRNCLHISLNFHPSEKHEREKLKLIAGTYMEKIGFGAQPYLVYSHHDAGHPHIHIVTTNIQATGKRIKLHNIGRNQSEKARKEIEEEYKLVKAQRQRQLHVQTIKPVQIQKIVYGKSETRQAISNVVNEIVNSYKYGSFPELNAVLGLYNVAATRGEEGSRTFEKRGLVYRVLDEQGNMTGVPIKASLLHSKPTLSFLEKKFEENQNLRQPHRQRIKNMIDWSLQKKEQTLDGIVQSLKKERIQAVIRQNKQGLIYGITFVDHQTKTVYKGSDIGKEYSAQKIIQRCNPKEVQFQHYQQKQDDHIHIQELKIIDELFSAEKQSDSLPYELKQTKRKRKRHSQNH